MIKQKKDAGIIRNRKNTTLEKLTIQLEEINQKVLAKEGRLKRYRQRVKQYRQNRTFKNNERKFYQQLERDDNKTYQQLDARETQWFWTKIWQPKIHNERAEWINNITRELEGLEKAWKQKYTLICSKWHLKKYQTGKRQAMMEYVVSGSRNSPPWQTSTRNEYMLTKSTCTWMDNQRKDHIDTKGPKQRNRPKQLQTHNVPTNDWENINSTNKGRNLLLANKPWFVPWWTERMLQRIQRHSRITLHGSTHSKWKQDQTEKSSYGLDWQQKGIWHGST